MSDVYGNLNIINGKILNLIIEPVEEIPPFSINDSGKLLRINNSLIYNTGEKWINIQFSNNRNDPLLHTLGDNWINPDLSFNPTPFNELNNISGLNANDSLFSVIEKLDDAISNVSNEELSNLSDVNLSNISSFDLLIYNGTNFSNISLDSLADIKLNMTTAKLKDVSVINNYSVGDILVFSGEKNSFVNRKIMSEYTNLAANTTFAINHNLGTKHCIVQPIDLVTDELITSNFNVTYLDENNLTITFSTPKSIKVLMSAVSIT